MPIFKLTVTHRGEGAQKAFLEDVINQLQNKGAHIINIQTKAGKVDEPPTVTNVITISYEATRKIKLS